MLQKLFNRRGIVLTWLLCCTVCLSKAQAPSFIAPNFTFTDLNGNSQTLYDYLDQGKTVYIDAFTAWCGPCWTYHNTHAFETLFEQHGPLGMSGVIGTSSNDVMVLAMEVEANNNTSAIYGVGSSVVTQGNWTTGINYPIIDVPPAQVAGWCAAWDVTAYPEIFRVCRDRIATRISASATTTLYQGSQNACPQYAPGTGADAKYFSYIAPPFHCSSIEPQLLFQNYSTAPLQQAVIRTYYDYIPVDSFLWNGNASPMQFVHATLPPINLPASVNNLPLSFKVTALNDIRPSNDYSGQVYNAHNYQNATAVPFLETFDVPTGDFWDKWLLSNRLFTTLGGNVTGPDGQDDPAVLAAVNSLAQGTEDTMYAGNYNLQGVVNPKLSFYRCYAQQWAGSGYANDRLTIMISSDCGAHWTTIWDKAGSQLATMSPVANGYFTPTAAAQWQKETVSLSATANEPNVVIALTAVADFGSNVFIDSFQIAAGALGLSSPSADAFQIYPNPVADKLIIQGNLHEQADFLITDIYGRQLHTGVLNDTGTDRRDLDVSSLPQGCYTICIRSGTRISRQNFIKLN